MQVPVTRSTSWNSRTTSMCTWRIPQNSRWSSRLWWIAWLEPEWSMWSRRKLRIRTFLKLMPKLKTYLKSSRETSCVASTSRRATSWGGSLSLAHSKRGVWQSRNSSPVSSRLMRRSYSISLSNYFSHILSFWWQDSRTTLDIRSLFCW